jgi:uncharacterized membrane protein
VPGDAAVPRDSVRTQLRPLPVAGVAGAVVLGVLLPHADAYLDATLPSWAAGALFSGDPGAARAVLDAVPSSLITVTALTFSLTVVALQLASSQFSPRLLARSAGTCSCRPPWRYSSRRLPIR